MLSAGFFFSSRTDERFSRFSRLIWVMRVSRNSQGKEKKWYFFRPHLRVLVSFTTFSPVHYFLSRSLVLSISSSLRVHLTTTTFTWNSRIAGLTHTHLHDTHELVFFYYPFCFLFSIALLQTNFLSLAVVPNVLHVFFVFCQRARGETRNFVQGLKYVESFLEISEVLLGPFLLLNISASIYSSKSER